MRQTNNRHSMVLHTTDVIQFLTGTCASVKVLTSVKNKKETNAKCPSSSQCSVEAQILRFQSNWNFLMNTSLHQWKIWCGSRALQNSGSTVKKRLLYSQKFEKTWTEQKNRSTAEDYYQQHEKTDWNFMSAA